MLLSVINVYKKITPDGLNSSKIISAHFNDKNALYLAVNRRGVIFACGDREAIIYTYSGFTIPIGTSYATKKKTYHVH